MCVHESGPDFDVSKSMQTPLLFVPLFYVGVVSTIHYMSQNILVAPRGAGGSAVEDNSLFDLLTFVSRCHLLLAVFTAVGLCGIVTAPFGRHAVRSRVSWRLPASLSWCLQESPTLLCVLYTVFYEMPMRSEAVWKGRRDDGFIEGMPHYLVSCLYDYMNSTNSIALSCFVLHYVHRAFIYPLCISPSAHLVPVHVTAAATLYCMFNGRLQVLASLSPQSALRAQGGLAATLQARTPRLEDVFLGETSVQETGNVILLALVLLSALLFLYGMYVNISSDYALLRLRRQVGTLQSKSHDVANDEGKYFIPRGGWFDSISCPNFFGEILEWTGYAALLWTSTALIDGPLDVESTASSAYGRVKDALALPAARCALYSGASFAVYTAANLLPRAVAHHAWYLQKFGTKYASLQRAAVIPKLL